MRTILATALFVALNALPAAADTYSWVDDQGVFNYSDDIAQVPKKYRKKVQKRSESTPVSEASTATGVASESQRDGSQAKVPPKAAASGGAGDLFGGKPYEQWRKELSAVEAELTTLEQQIQQMANQAKAARGFLNNNELENLKTRYDEATSSYKAKYQAYMDLVESARKAGVVVNFPEKSK